MKLEIKIEKEIKKQISKYPFKKGTIVYVAGNTFNFGMGTAEIKKFCKYFLNYLKKITGPNGGVIVPTATLNLIKNKKVYDKKKTKSYTMGIFSEYVRNQKKSHRSDHPLWSFSGLGTKVKKILKNVSYSAYGEGSVFDKLMNYKTYFICLGEPNTSIGMIHYVENLYGVPYRFNKEFYIKTKKNNKITSSYSLLGVRFKSKNMIGDGNKQVVSKLKKMKTFKKIKFKKGAIYICEYQKIVNNLKLIFAKNPRIWLKNKNQIQKTYLKY